jgi:tRNA (pseudouridine54-N1)-methyltransferase
MSHLQEVLSTSKRNFIVVAHRARSDGGININDLCGASGRWDGIARCITSALFLSHDMRRDTSIHILLLGPDDPAKVLSINGNKVKYLNPDERASSALMGKCLKEPLGKETDDMINPSPGISIIRSGLSDILRSLSGPLIYLNEGGSDPGQIIHDIKGGFNIYFIASDDKDLSEIEYDMVAEKADHQMRLGEKILHTHMAITITHYLLDLEPSDQLT